MKKIFFTTFILTYSISSFAINGQEYVDCLEKTMNQTISEYKQLEAAREKSSRNTSVKICNKMTKQLYGNFKATFVERDQKNNRDVPYTHEDMQISKIEDYYLDVQEQMECFKAEDKTVTSETIKRYNEKIIHKMFQKMTGYDDLESNMSKTLEELDTVFCKNIQ